ncbi:MAG: YbhB/YbcL family Raf kinase inhibitor-like protein, partial [Rubrivivax sp.]
YEVNYGQFSGVYTFLDDGNFYGLHFVDSGATLAGHPHGKLTVANSATAQESIAWANFIDDAGKVGSQETTGLFGLSFSNTTGLSVSIHGSMGSFTAMAATQKPWSAGSASTLYANPLPLITIAGSYDGILRTVGINTPQQSVTNLAITADGSFSVTSADCTFTGKLLPHGTTGILDTAVTTSGASCKLNANLKGIVTPLSITSDVPQLGFQLNSADNTQTAVFVVKKTSTFSLSSKSFAANTTIPAKYSCAGGETSPHLQWALSTSNAKSYALIMEDPDAIPIVGYPYVHWDVFQIPGATLEIAEGASRTAMPAGSVEGTNDDGLARYSGPCPPSGTHRYIFAVYALNVDKLTITTNKAVRRSDFEKTFAGSILQKAEMQANYTR